MKLLLLLLLLQLVYCNPIWVGATPPDPLAPSPAFSPNSPLSATMAAPTTDAYSPGILHVSFSLSMLPCSFHLMLFFLEGSRFKFQVSTLFKIFKFRKRPPN